MLQNDLYNGTGNYQVLADVLGNHSNHFWNSFFPTLLPGAVLQWFR
jgi:hypothetical protein